MVMPADSDDEVDRAKPGVYPFYCKTSARSHQECRGTFA